MSIFCESEFSTQSEVNIYLHSLAKDLSNRLNDCSCDIHILNDEVLIYTKPTGMLGCGYIPPTYQTEIKCIINYDLEVAIYFCDRLVSKVTTMTDLKIQLFQCLDAYNDNNRLN
jgi:hypothetical protein